MVLMESMWGCGGLTIPAAPTEADTQLDEDTDDGLRDTGVEPQVSAISHVVIAGGSWSAGSVAPTRAALEAWGHGDVVVRSETTAVVGSTAAQWASNHDGKLNDLAAALDDAEAPVLLLYLGAQDYSDGLTAGRGDDLAAEIGADIAAVIADARAGRPALQVVLVDYSYFHYEWFTEMYRMDLGDTTTLTYNQGLTAIGAEKLALARQTEGVHYVHNFGALQHHLGLTVSSEWSLPLEDYPPGMIDLPSAAPAYDPFPGGLVHPDLAPESLPGPVEGYLDGVHLSQEGWSILLENTCDQGLSRLLVGQAW
jgi:hypothetical protein